MTSTWLTLASGHPAPIFDAHGVRTHRQIDESRAVHFEAWGRPAQFPIHPTKSLDRLLEMSLDWIISLTPYSVALIQFSHIQYEVCIQSTPKNYVQIKGLPVLNGSVRKNVLSVIAMDLTSPNSDTSKINPALYYLDMALKLFGFNLTASIVYAISLRNIICLFLLFSDILFALDCKVLQSYLALQDLM